MCRQKPWCTHGHMLAGAHRVCELLMNWLLPLSGLVMPLQSETVYRGSIFFSANRTVAPDHFIQWWSSNDSVYESDNKKREGNRLFWRCSHSFVDYKQFCFFFPFLLLRSHGQIRFCCGMSFVCLFLYIYMGGCHPFVLVLTSGHDYLL